MGRRGHPNLKRPVRQLIGSLAVLGLTFGAYNLLNRQLARADTTLSDQELGIQITGVGRLFLIIVAVLAVVFLLSSVSTLLLIFFNAARHPVKDF